MPNLHSTPLDVLRYGFKNRNQSIVGFVTSKRQTIDARAERVQAKGPDVQATREANSNRVDPIVESTGYLSVEVVSTGSG